MNNLQQIVPSRIFFALLTLSIGSLSVANAETHSESQNLQPSNAKNSENALDYIPRWVDATPTIFPEQSDQPTVPPTAETEDKTWFDKKQRHIREWADHTSIKIDDWFGDVDPENPASATIRVMLDNYWNQYDNYEIKPRIRGKIKLPTLEKRFSVVFGDDSLDDEFKNNVANTNNQPNQDPGKKFERL